MEYEEVSKTSALIGVGVRIPVGSVYTDMAELEDALDLGSGSVMNTGSNPVIRIN